MFVMLHKNLVKGYTNMTALEFKLFMVAVAEYRRCKAFNETSLKYKDKDKLTIILEKEILESIFGKKHTSETYMKKAIGSLLEKEYVSQDAQSFKICTNLHIQSNMVEVVLNEQLMVDAKKDAGKYISVKVEDILRLNSSQAIMLYMIQKTHSENMIIMKKEIIPFLLGNGEKLENKYISRYMKRATEHLEKKLLLSVDLQDNSANDTQVLLVFRQAKIDIEELKKEAEIEKEEQPIIKEYMNNMDDIFSNVAREQLKSQPTMEEILRGDIFKKQETYISFENSFIPAPGCPAPDFI